jgi:hypothetical protein
MGWDVIMCAYGGAPARPLAHKLYGMHAPACAQDRLLTKMYSEAVRHLPPGQYLIPLDHFVDTARTFGFDRWRVGAVQGTAGPAACDVNQ